jgi:hypothetical protein
LVQKFLKKLTGKDLVAVAHNVWALFVNSAHAQNRTLLGSAWDTLVDFTSEQWEAVLGAVVAKVPPSARAGLSRPPTLIYQPGRVGSISVLRSVRRAGRRTFLYSPVHHAHYLFQIPEMEAFIKANRENAADSLRDLEKSKRIRREIDADPTRHWNIITLVRDPVALRISGLFHNLHEYFPGWANLSTAGTLTIAELQNVLVTAEEFRPQYLDDWFQVEFKGMLGYDAYAVPFDTEHGYSIYQIDERFRLMIVRLEDLNRVAAQAFGEFLGLRRFTVRRTNTAEQSAYFDLYQRFIAAPVPEQYVRAAYSTRWARHFYSEPEIEAFTSRWTTTSSAG